MKKYLERVDFHIVLLLSIWTILVLLVTSAVIDKAIGEVKILRVLFILLAELGTDGFSLVLLYNPIRIEG